MHAHTLAPTFVSSSFTPFFSVRNPCRSTNASTTMVASPPARLLVSTPAVSQKATASTATVPAPAVTKAMPMYPPRSNVTSSSVPAQSLSSVLSPPLTRPRSPAPSSIQRPKEHPFTDSAASPMQRPLPKEQPFVDSPTSFSSPSSSAVALPRVASPTEEQRIKTELNKQWLKELMEDRNESSEEEEYSEDELDLDEFEDDDDDVNTGRTRKLRRRKSKSATKSRRKKSTEVDSVRTYLTEIGQHKLLSADDEVDLARDIKRLLKFERLFLKFQERQGRSPTELEWSRECKLDPKEFRYCLFRGRRAKETMIQANLRLVVSIAKKYMNRGLSLQDMIQEGSIGLIRGAERFDGEKGFKFSTYATWWIRQSIIRAIAELSRQIRLPVHINDTLTNIRKVTRQLTEELGRPPLEKEIADRLEMDVEKLRFISMSTRNTVSLETPVTRSGSNGSSGEPSTLGSFIEWDGLTPENSIVQNFLREDLEAVLSTLRPREQEVIRLRYGFDDGNTKTLEEIGMAWDVSRERVRQIEAKALRKLRHPKVNAVLREYFYEE